MNFATSKNPVYVRKTAPDGMDIVEGVETRPLAGSLASHAAANSGPIDSATFESFQAGNPEAMTAVVRAYQNRLIGFIRLFTRGREMAEEIAQEVFIDAFRQRAEVYNADALRPWLFTLARRKAIKETMRRRNQMEVAVDDDTLHDAAPPVPPGQAAGVLSTEVRAFLHEALGDLPPVDRDLITLRYFADLPLKEIAQVLRMPMGSVGVKLGRALAKLRKSLERRGLHVNDLMP